MKVVLPNDVAAIKKAVDDGHTVYDGDPPYEVRKDHLGQYFIVCSLNNYSIGLHGMKDTPYEHELNGNGPFWYEA